MKYNSLKDTKKHIAQFREYMGKSKAEIDQRFLHHDRSKTQDPEKKIFDEYTPKLKDCTYGSEEYKGYLEEMKEALDHHYRENRHHPEHFENGINDMNLIDLLEMVCDWTAATKRHNDGDIKKSLKINKSRFKIAPQLNKILSNTVEFLEG